MPYFISMKHIEVAKYFTKTQHLLGIDPLFASAGNRTRGERMTTRGVRERVNHYLEVAGVKKGRLRQITPYSLRHTAAVLMAEAGATADEIRDRMRLGSVMTALLYMNKARIGDGKKDGGKEGR